MVIEPMLQILLTVKIVRKRPSSFLPFVSARSKETAATAVTCLFALLRNGAP